MKNISTTDFEQLEKLLQNKQFEELNSTEKQWVLKFLLQEEYNQMSALYTSINALTFSNNLNPQNETKTRLNKVLAAKTQKRNLFQIKIPFYQSVAAAVIFFLIGFGLNESRPVKNNVVDEASQVIKYVDRPVKQIEYIYVKEKKRNVKLPQSHPVVSKEEELLVDNKEFKSNPEIVRQQKIARNNIHQVLNEQNGSNLKNDSLLQKMLATIY